ncbi:hypothetical protein [Pseudotabrizicola sp. 4114]|uniref:hypothetical protein n=1 Tax=Pseudotabrizicola sp. 4114 TaxID=2817731 RepID=UPI00285F3A7F|nr:hypothetical protein [Pseudorhodobacter sp. 4114]
MSGVGDGWCRIVKWVAVMVLVAGIGVAPRAGVAGPLTFDCVGLGAKSGDAEAVCALFGQRLAAAFPGRLVTRAPAADVVLAIDRATARSFMARLDWRGQPPGEMRGIARQDADLDDAARSELIDSLMHLSLR